MQVSHLLTFLLILLLCTCGRAQENNEQLSANILKRHADITSFNPNEVLVQDDARPKVLLVGSFHFDYPNLDTHVTDATDQVDVTKKQAEVQELLDYIARFKPNKIVVERRPGSRVNEAYHKYLAGEYELRKSEIQQIGFRLGKRFNIDTLILGDAFNFQNSLWWDKDSTIFRPMIDSMWNAQDTDWDSTMNERYMTLYEVEDKLEGRSHLLDIFKYLNSVHRTRLGHGNYLEFDSDEDVDLLAIWWYSRNLRIYRQIQKSTTSPDDRILVLFGAGHLSILRQQFESSPAYELVDFNSLDRF